MSSVTMNRTTAFRRFQRPLSHRLLQPIFLPVCPLLDHARYRLRGIGLDHSPQLDSIAYDLVSAALHHYFVDADARRWNEIWEWLSDRVVCGFNQDIQLELISTLHRMLSSSTGPLMPSYLYRYLIDGDSLILTPTMPTMEDYERRICEMADPDDGWIPPRYRR